MGAVSDGCQALSGHQLHDGPRLAKSKELFQDEQLLFRSDHQPAVQHLPAGKLDRHSGQCEAETQQETVQQTVYLQHVPPDIIPRTPAQRAQDAAHLQNTGTRGK